MILSNVTVPLLGAVDTAVIGHLPDPVYLGGVAAGASLFTFLFWSFGFLRMSTTGFAAQAEGRGRAEEVAGVAYRALAIAITIGVMLIALQAAIADVGFGFVGASRAVEGQARLYFSIRIWGAPAALTSYVLLGWFLGLQNARIPLLLQVFVNGINIALALLFVVGLEWGVAGVAAATVIAEYASLGLGAILMIRALRARAALPPRWSNFSPAAMRRMLVVNLDIFVRTLLLVFAFLYFTAQGARMGDIHLAANAVLMNLHIFATFALDGFAYATQALVGMAVGARDEQALRQAVRAAALWTAAGAGLLAAAYLMLGPTLIRILTGIPEVQTAAAMFLPWAIAAPIVSAAAFLLDGVFVGATRSAEQRNAMIVSAVVYITACWILVPIWDNHGLWLAFLLFMAARGLTLGALYRRVVRSVRV